MAREVTGVLAEETIISLDISASSFYLTLKGQDSFSVPVLVKLYNFGGIELVSLDTLDTVNAITVCTLIKSVNNNMMLVYSDKDANYTCDLRNCELNIALLTEKLRLVTQVVTKSELELSSLVTKLCGSSTIVIKGEPAKDYTFKKSVYLTTGYFHEYTAKNGSVLFATNMSAFVHEKEKVGYKRLKNSENNRLEVLKNGNIHFLGADSNSFEVTNNEEADV